MVRPNNVRKQAALNATRLNADSAAHLLLSAISNSNLILAYPVRRRTWSNSTYMNGLCDSRTSEEKAELVDELFHRYVDKVAKDPSSHAMDYVHSYAIIERVK
ncbi:MAG: hypothetical protein VXY99_10045 [Pseudomonadota bacterium]|nr:hypothetical protein [Pseudomonadota bacterium]